MIINLEKKLLQSTRLAQLRLLLASDFANHQGNMARAIKKNQAQINHWLSGHRAIGEQVARDIEQALGLPQRWMDGESVSIGNTMPVSPNASVPLISLVRAGGWGEIDDHEPDTAERINCWECAPSKYAFALTVTGDSMTTTNSPSFPNGCRIIVEPERTPQAGNYVVAKDVTTQKATFKRLMTDGNRWYLQSLNPIYPPIEIDDPALRVIGVVIEWQAGGRL
jgi:SOS-response transcriptional repressor LexA